MFPHHGPGFLVEGAHEEFGRRHRQVRLRLHLVQEQQRLRHERSAARQERVTGCAERRQQQAFECRMIHRPVAVRDLPRDLAFVEIDRGHGAVRRLDQRQALRPGRSGGAANRIGGLLRTVAFHHGGERHDVRRLQEQVTRFGIEAGAAPVRTARRARHLQHALLAVLADDGRRREQRTERVVGDDLQRFGAQLRSEVDQVVGRETLPCERRRLRRKRLRCRCLFARHRRLRHGPLFDRPHRLAGRALEYVREALLADLRDCLDAAAVHSDVDERRRGGEVVVPQSVVHALKVPHELAAVRRDREQALGVKIIAVTIAAVIVVGRRADRNEHEAELGIRAERRPRVGVARVLPRLVLPRLDAGLGPLRHRVEEPLRRAGYDVERLHVTCGHFRRGRTIEHGAADHDRVADDHRRRIEADEATILFLADQRCLQIDASVLAERRDRLTRARVECDQLADAGCDEDAPLGAAAHFA